MRHNLDQWIKDLEKRAEESLAREAKSLDTETKNTRIVDLLLERAPNVCGNPFCKIPLQVDRTVNYARADYGDVCATCNDLRVAVAYNAKLRNWNYFRELHEKWKIEEELRRKNEKKHRDRLGLDDNGGSDGIT
jgi:hypothetical protein